ncbi:MAG: tRNA epoxyqueuosine(34) reductase QueG [Gammaproteobacteria bacterium]
MQTDQQNRLSHIDREKLVRDIKSWGMDLGFQQTGIAPVNLDTAAERLQQWLEDGMHGEMSYMATHGSKRYTPTELVDDTASVISVRMDYLHGSAAESNTILDQQDKAFIARYALGRDYHKLIRNRLQKLAARIEQAIGQYGYRVFVDSAPVLEKPLAQNAGLGWIGKHTNLLNKEAGSWFFLGEIYVDLDLPADTPAIDHCGSCTRCIDVCPTGAIIAPYRLDARRCISYLTIELRGSIPEEFREPIGNRIFGCDDCQLVCPWNKFARYTKESDFASRHGLDEASLVDLFAWGENEFLDRTTGMAIRRTGHIGWLRNIAVALGNCDPSDRVRDALEKRRNHSSPVVREHVQWALKRQLEKQKHA